MNSLEGAGVHAAAQLMQQPAGDASPNDYAVLIAAAKVPCGSRPCCRSTYSLTGLEDPIREHLLPLLPLRTLGVLACSNRWLRNLVRTAPAAFWKERAASHLGPHHPALSRKGGDVLAALQVHAVAHRNMAAQRHTQYSLRSLLHRRDAATVLISRDGNMLATVSGPANKLVLTQLVNGQGQIFLLDHEIRALQWCPPFCLHCSPTNPPHVLVV